MATKEQKKRKYDKLREQISLDGKIESSKKKIKMISKDVRRINKTLAKAVATDLYDAEIKYTSAHINLNPTKAFYGSKANFNAAAYAARKMREWIRWANLHRSWDKPSMEGGALWY